MRKLKVVCFLAIVLTMGVPLMLFEFNCIMIASAFAQTKDQCSAQLILAEEEYFSESYSEVILLVNECLDKASLIDIEKENAYKILSLLYIYLWIQ